MCVMQILSCSESHGWKGNKNKKKRIIFIFIIIQKEKYSASRTKNRLLYVIHQWKYMRILFI